MKYKSSSIRSKWVKTRWLVRNQELRTYVPHTTPFNRKSLTSMLTAYPIVFLKPTGGSGGSKIIKITRKPSGYQTQYKANKTTHPTLDALYSHLKRFTQSKPFILQKGIVLARTNDRPFDIRVMVQKTNKGAWMSTAIFTKIGRPGKVATNYNQGGAIGYFKPTMLRAGLDHAAIQHYVKKLERLGVTVGRCFDQHKRGFRELGLDVALDSEGRAWILEVNTRPHFYPLKDMSNKKLYRTILSYARQYGRAR